MRDISKYVDTESPLYDKLLRLYDENKDFPLENIKGRNVHHIVLRSWSRIDGEETDNTEENLVSLTAADHILAHFYIWKISKSPYRRSAASAWYFMSRTLLKFGIDENTIICLIDKYNEEIKLCDKERRKYLSETKKGKCRSEEIKKKISETKKGHLVSKETRKKLSEALKGKLNFKGKCHSEETKKKISEAHKGKKRGQMSEETKKKMSEAHKGKTTPEEIRKKMSELKKGKHWKLIDGKRVWY